MRVTIDWPESWNYRRYSRPWIARVRGWPIGGQPEHEWGGWLGQNGSAGELEIEAESGDIIRWGQKDHRNPRKTQTWWGVVDVDGNVVECSASDARKLWAVE